MVVCSTIDSISDKVLELGSINIAVNYEGATKVKKTTTTKTAAIHTSKILQ